MFLIEPQRTQYDLHFQIAGIPVRVHPLFWLAALILGYTGAQGSEDAGALVLVWVSAMFVSILVHELGHAFTMRYFGESPQVVLYLMGGLAISGGSASSLNYGGRHRSRLSQIIISAAGPAAGFLLAGWVVALLLATGGGVVFAGQIIPFITGVSNPYLYALVFYLLLINVLWGLINLLPVYPLDGGQIARELLVGKNPSEGMRQSLWLSVVTGAAVAVLGLIFLKSLFMAILFGSLAFSSYQLLQSFGGHGGGGFGGRPW